MFMAAQVILFAVMCRSGTMRVGSTLMKLGGSLVGFLRHRFFPMRYDALIGRFLLSNCAHTLQEQPL